MTYVLGAWKVVCDRCGFTYLNTELRSEWTGLKVCRKCWDPKHPQLSVTGKADDQTVPWARPQPEPNWTVTNDWNDF